MLGGYPVNRQCCVMVCVFTFQPVCSFPANAKQWQFILLELRHRQVSAVFRRANDFGSTSPLRLNRCRKIMSERVRSSGVETRSTGLPAFGVAFAVSLKDL